MMFLNASQLAKQLAFVLTSTRKRCNSLSIITTHLRKSNLINKLGVSSPLLLSLSLWKSKTADIDVNEFMTAPITPLDILKSNKDSMRSQFELFVMKVQKEVCDALQEIESKGDDTNSDKESIKFKVDRWTREEGGGGITCVMQDGLVFEKAGVNISVVYGDLPSQAAQQMRARGKALKDNVQLKFFACGVSSVIHPRNPNVPTLHFNYRYFEVKEGENYDNNQIQWWFGGGTDMTPYILNESDAIHFHKTLKTACDKHDREYYPKFKKWCDNYFFISHRNERRGIGGLFFDDVDYPNQTQAFNFVKSCANAVIPCYVPIVNNNVNKGYSYSDREWQLLRRGRYVEFNLIYDRGTKFGLMTPGARYESILMSLPLVARWEYCHAPKPGTPEDSLIQVLKNPKEWV